MAGRYIVEYMYVWDIPGANAIREMDFALTYGDGITLHTVENVIAAVFHSGHSEAKPLLEELEAVRKDRGKYFYLGF